MSLEVDLLMPPRGPLKWRWLTEMLAKLSKAAGILSPDGSVQINPTTGGVTLYTPPPVSTLLKIEGLERDQYRVPELLLSIDDISDHTLSEQIITVLPGQLLCIAVTYALTEEAGEDVARMGTRFVASDIAGTPSVALVAISRAELESAQAARPMGDSSGVIYIPLAVQENGLVVLHQFSGFLLELGHGFFTFST
jgi:hypothetical protein